MHDVFAALSVANDLLDQVFVWQVPAHYMNQQHNLLISATNANKMSYFSASQNTAFGSQGKNFENLMFTFGCFSLTAIYNFCKLQRRLQVATILIMNSFSHTNILFLFRCLPTEILIFINVCYQMKCFGDDSVSCFRNRFC